MGTFSHLFTACFTSHPSPLTHTDARVCLDLSQTSRLTPRVMTSTSATTSTRVTPPRAIVITLWEATIVSAWMVSWLIQSPVSVRILTSAYLVPVEVQFA